MHANVAALCGDPELKNSMVDDVNERRRNSTPLSLRAGNFVNNQIAPCAIYFRVVVSGLYVHGALDFLPS